MALLRVDNEHKERHPTSLSIASNKLSSTNSFWTKWSLRHKFTSRTHISNESYDIEMGKKYIRFDVAREEYIESDQVCRCQMAEPSFLHISGLTPNVLVTIYPLSIP
jgi:hypothetical protein